MKTKLLLDLKLSKYQLISVNRAYRFYDPKKKNKYQPYVGDKIEHNNIATQIKDKYKGKPLKINYIKADINTSTASDIDNKGKTLLDASENIVIQNDKDISKILFRRAEFNRATYKNKGNNIIIDFKKGTFSNSVNKHWKSASIKLTQEAKVFKRDIKTLASFYKERKKYISSNEIIVIINTTLRNDQDLDNVFKLILDSFTNIIYKDDKQISFIFATKEIENKKKNNLRVRIFEKIKEKNENNNITTIDNVYD